MSRFWSLWVEMVYVKRSEFGIGHMLYLDLLWKVRLVSRNFQRKSSEPEKKNHARSNYVRYELPEHQHPRKNYIQFLSEVRNMFVPSAEFFMENCLVYYESIKWEQKRRPIYEWRCDERLKTKAEGSTRLAYNGLLGGLEHLKIETRLIDERFVSLMGECDFEVIGVPSRLRFTRKAAALARVLPTLDLSCEENAVRRKWTELCCCSYCAPKPDVEVCCEASSIVLCW